MWYRRQIATCLDSGETYSIVGKVSDFDDDITPTIWFEHFEDVPIFTAMSECFETVDITQAVNDLLPQSPQEKEIIPDSRHLKDVERGGDKDNRKSRKEKGWEAKKVKT